jgi:hypothetical protein
MQAAPDPHFDTWLDWLERGHLGPELAELQRSDPERFSLRAAEVRRFLADLSNARFEPLTQSERQAGLAALQAADRPTGRGLRERFLQLAQRVLAGPELAPALRGSAPISHFQGLYRAGAWDIDLGLGEDGRLRGQVLHQQAAALPPGAEVLVLVSGRPVHGQVIESDGSFAVNPPTGQDFELQFELGEERLLVAGLPTLG